MRMPVAAILSSAMLALLTALASCSGAPETVMTQPPDLSGSWVLNEAESEDLRGRMRGGGIEDDGGPGMAGGRRGRMGGMDRERMRQAMQMLREASRVLKIIQDDSTITVASAGGAKRVLFPDGRKVEHELRNGTAVETKARWKDDRLVVERKFDGGVKITETYERTGEGRQLHVEVKLGGGIPRSLEFRRVYDAVDESG